jgi:hypothetical protein
MGKAGPQSRFQHVVGDDGRAFVHREVPSRTQPKPRITTESVGITESVDRWENEFYYGLVRRFTNGFPIGGGPYCLISIGSVDHTAMHDWRDFQQLKNHLVGEEWEAVELYPAESRLKDPSNWFYLWCVPKGVLEFGLPGGRLVLAIAEAKAPQRPFPGDKNARRPELEGVNVHGRRP